MNIISLTSYLLGILILGLLLKGIKGDEKLKVIVQKLKLPIVFLTIGLILQFSHLLITETELFSNPLKEKITSENASEYLNQICNDLDEESCTKLREAFKMPFLVYNADHTGPSAVVVLYDKPLNQITFADLMKRAGITE